MNCRDKGYQPSFARGWPTIRDKGCAESWCNRTVLVYTPHMSNSGGLCMFRIFLHLTKWVSVHVLRVFSCSACGKVVCSHVLTHSSPKACRYACRWSDRVWNNLFQFSHHQVILLGREITFQRYDLGHGGGACRNFFIFKLENKRTSLFLVMSLEQLRWFYLCVNTIRWKYLYSGHTWMPWCHVPKGCDKIK